MKDKPFRVVFLVAFLLINPGLVSIFAQTNFTLLKSFSVSGGSQPLSRLCLGRDNVLYGTTSVGGSVNAGTIFRVNLDGSSYTTLKEFSDQTGVSLSLGSFKAAMVLFTAPPVREAPTTSALCFDCVVPVPSRFCTPSRAMQTDKILGQP